MVESFHNRLKEFFVVFLHLNLSIERFNTGVLECVKLLSDRAHVIDPSLRVGVLFIVRRAAIIQSRLYLPRFDTPKHGINCFSFVVPFSHSKRYESRRPSCIVARGPGVCV